ncbi:MAG: peptidoglycan-binding protein [Actinobacteria bacterium]|nr:peptidoglycan-binding protein [Actinomycetota bacterium]
MRRSLTLVTAAVLGVLVLAGPAFAALTNPTSPAAAPAVVEGFSPYLPQTSCDPAAKPGTAALRTLLIQTYGGRDLGITRNCGIGATSEHKEGRAFDWGLNVGVPEEAAIADAFLTWLLEPGDDGISGYNARRLGIMYVIWNGRIWGSYGSGWKTYSGAEAHTDHIHISLSWNGAMKATSFWTGTAAPTDYGPCRKYVGLPVEKYSVPRTSATCPPAAAPMSLTGVPLLQQGSTGGYVAQLQTLLQIAVDGAYGAKTAAAVSAFQTARALPATGVVDEATWGELRKPVATSPAPSLSPTATPTPKPTVTPSPKPTMTPTPTPVLTTPVAVVLPPAPLNKALAPYSGLTLQQGAKGAAVVALQKALYLMADGAFGPKTASAVKAYSSAHGLRAEPVVRPATWRMLGAPPAPAGKDGARRWLPSAR